MRIASPKSIVTFFYLFSIVFRFSHVNTFHTVRSSILLAVASLAVGNFFPNRLARLGGGGGVFRAYVGPPRGTLLLSSAGPLLPVNFLGGTNSCGLPYRRHMSNPYPPQRQAYRALEIAYPDAEVELRENLAYLVSVRRQTITDAFDFLERRQKGTIAASGSRTDGRVKVAPVPSTSATTTEAPRHAPSSTRIRRVSVAPPSPAHHPMPASILSTSTPSALAPATALPSATKTTTAPSVALCGTTRPPPTRTVKATTALPNAKPPAVVPSSTGTDSTVCPVINDQPSSYFYGDNAENYDTEVLHAPGQVIMFTTCMTGDRRVRDHCRQLEGLLYLKGITPHVMDVADNAFLQRKARQLYKKGTGCDEVPQMPMLVVDDTWIGGYEDIQDLEDNRMLDDTLYRAGYRGHSTDPKTRDAASPIGQHPREVEETASNGKASRRDSVTVPEDGRTDRAHEPTVAQPLPTLGLRCRTARPPTSSAVALSTENANWLPRAPPGDFLSVQQLGVGTYGWSELSWPQRRLSFALPRKNFHPCGSPH